MSDESEENPKALGRGRPSTLTPAVLGVIEEHILHGSHPETACQAAGISLRTFQHWCKRGEDEPDSMYGEFLRVICVADARAELAVTRSVFQATEDDPEVGLKFMGRRWAKRWQQEQKVEINAKVQMQVAQFDYSKLSMEELETMERLALKAQAQLPANTKDGNEDDPS